MLAAPIPDNDTERLAALRELLILDTPPEQRFDKVVRFAAEEFDMPIALLSLIDENRQWFKANVGLDVCETARDISFCGHAILQSDIFVIPDARAGAPLRMPSGFTIGTLCIIDHKPRTLDATELAILTTLRDLLLEELNGSAEAAERLLRERSFQGAVISIDCVTIPGCEYNLTLLDRVRHGMYASDSAIPIAVMAEHATAELLQDLRARNVNRVILKPFRAKVLLDAFASFEQAQAPKP